MPVRRRTAVLPGCRAVPAEAGEPSPHGAPADREAVYRCSHGRCTRTVRLNRVVVRPFVRPFVRAGLRQLVTVGTYHLPVFSPDEHVGSYICNAMNATILDVVGVRE
jgi:hypothetical protein